MGVEYPRLHDPAPVLLETLRQRQIVADAAFLAGLSGLSARLSEIRGPAFYHEIEVTEPEAQEAVEAAGRVLAFGIDLLGRLRRGPREDPGTG
jgi:HEPN domain-containing protein